MSPPVALVIGHTGQDGTILCNSLRDAGYAVHGVSTSAVQVPGMDSFDVTNGEHASSLIRIARPDEVYYLAAFHHSAEEPGLKANDEVLRRSLDVHVLGLQRILSAIQAHSPSTKLFYAASSHVFGPGGPAPFDEESALAPGCIYGITKAAGVQLCRYYRSTHGLFVSSGILFNHESPLRKPHFLSQKIAEAVADIKMGAPRRLLLGNLDATVDWGYAPDFVKAMRLVLALPCGDDFVVATGQAHTVAQFAAEAFSAVGLDWRDWVDVRSGIIVKHQPVRLGNAAKLRRLTGWAPTVTFPEMVKILVDAATARKLSAVG